MLQLVCRREVVDAGPLPHPWKLQGRCCHKSRCCAPDTSSQQYELESTLCHMNEWWASGAIPRPICPPASMLLHMPHNRHSGASSRTMSTRGLGSGAAQTSDVNLSRQKPWDGRMSHHSGIQRLLRVVCLPLRSLALLLSLPLLC